MLHTTQCDVSLAPVRSAQLFTWMGVVMVGCGEVVWQMRVQGKVRRAHHVQKFLLVRVPGTVMVVLRVGRHGRGPPRVFAAPVVLC